MLSPDGAQVEVLNLYDPGVCACKSVLLLNRGEIHRMAQISLSQPWPD
jgi:hypothetical protein